MNVNLQKTLVIKLEGADEIDFFKTILHKIVDIESALMSKSYLEIKEIDFLEKIKNKLE